MSRRKKAKKTGPVGGLGVRYGVRSRRRYREIMTEKKKKHTCPQCSSNSVKRESVGIWLCTSCGHKFSGGLREKSPVLFCLNCDIQMCRDIFIQRKKSRDSTLVESILCIFRKHLGKSN